MVNSQEGQPNTHGESSPKRSITDEVLDWLEADLEDLVASGSGVARRDNQPTESRDSVKPAIASGDALASDPQAETSLPHPESYQDVPRPPQS